MQHINTCKNCRYFQADHNQEGFVGECRIDAPVGIPQKIYDEQSNYTHTEFIGHWPGVFGDDSCGKYKPSQEAQNRATANAEAQPLPEVVSGADKATEAARTKAEAIVETISCRLTEKVMEQLDDLFNKGVIIYNHEKVAK